MEEAVYEVGDTLFSDGAAAATLKETVLVLPLALLTCTVQTPGSSALLNVASSSPLET